MSSSQPPLSTSANSSISGTTLGSLLTDASVSHVIAGLTPVLSAVTSVGLVEERIRQRKKTMLDTESAGVAKQERIVAVELAKGTDKRQIRKIKNRLSAVRSRLRKEAEAEALEDQVTSLKMQLAACADVIRLLCHDQDKSMASPAAAASGAPAIRLPTAAAPKSSPTPQTTTTTMTTTTTTPPSTPAPRRQDVEMLQETPASHSAQPHPAPVPEDLSKIATIAHSSPVAEPAELDKDNECGTPMISGTRATRSTAMQNLALLLGCAPAACDAVVPRMQNPPSSGLGSLATVVSPNSQSQASQWAKATTCSTTSSNTWKPRQATAATTPALTMTLISTILSLILTSVPGLTSSTSSCPSYRQCSTPRCAPRKRQHRQHRQQKPPARFTRRWRLRKSSRKSKLLQMRTRRGGVDTDRSAPLHSVSLRSLLSRSGIRRLRLIAQRSPELARRLVHRLLVRRFGPQALGSKYR